MTNGSAKTEPRTRWRPRRRGLLVAAVVGGALLACWGGCSYEQLSFWFDGVPDPSLSGVATDEFGRPIPYKKHQPYADNACAACHRTSRNLVIVRVRRDVCLDCHEGVTEEHPLMHGPVASSACLWCHDAHESQFEHLLKTRAAEVCLQCHGLTMEESPAIPEHEDLERSCLDCHYGHGGAEPFMLRDRSEWAAEDVQEP